tara:strand:- start:217 stop:372 length:156 start_codon:yes stop_codon:yes gene_type:complete
MLKIKKNFRREVPRDLGRVLVDAFALHGLGIFRTRTIDEIKPILNKIGSLS